MQLSIKQILNINLSDRFVCRPAIWLIATVIALVSGCMEPQQLNERQRGAFQPLAAGSHNGEPVNQSQNQEPPLSDDQHSNWSMFLDEKFPEVSGELAFLNDGFDFLKARLALIAAAKHSIRMQTYTIFDDETGRLVVDALIGKARSGVDVRVILDPVQNFSLDRQMLYQRMLSAGIKLQGYAPLYSKFIDRIMQQDTDSLLQELNMRYHDKLLVIDGDNVAQAMALTGGANIGNTYFRVMPDQPEAMWRDRDVMVRGAIVQYLTQVFDRTFVEFSERFSEGITQWANAFLGGFADNGPLLEASHLNQQRLAWIQERLQKPLDVVWHAATMRFISSRPRFGEDYIHPTYTDEFNRAENEILILNSYFLPNQDILDAISRAVNRGVAVTILVNHAKAIDFPVVQTLTRSYYQEILAMNDQPGAKGRVQIFEWQGDAVLGNGEGQNHSKYALFDQRRGIVGSYNLDSRSQNFNSESVLVFDSLAAAAPFKAEFDSFLTEDFSSKITRDQAAQYHRPTSVQESLLLILAKSVEFLL